MNTIFRASLIFSAVYFSLGCMEASLTNLEVPTKIPLIQKSQLSGFVSGAQVKKQTGNFVVESSTGNFTENLVEHTPGGYKVYISVQGGLISD